MKTKKTKKSWFISKSFNINEFDNRREMEKILVELEEIGYCNVQIIPFRGYTLEEESRVHIIANRKME